MIDKTESTGELPPGTYIHTPRDVRPTEEGLLAEIAALRAQVVGLETALAAIPDMQQPNGIPISQYEHLARCSSRSLRERDAERARADQAEAEYEKEAGWRVTWENAAVRLEAEAAVLQKRVAELEGEREAERREAKEFAQGVTDADNERSGGKHRFYRRHRFGWEPEPTDGEAK